MLYAMVQKIRHMASRWEENEDNSSRKDGNIDKKKTFDTVLGEGDRIEIYRPLAATPQELRRRRLQNGNNA